MVTKTLVALYTKQKTQKRKVGATNSSSISIGARVVAESALHQP